MSLIGKNLVGPDPTLLPEEPEVGAAIEAGKDAAEIAARHPASSLAWATMAVLPRVVAVRTTQPLPQWRWKSG